jgi:CDP-diacylglycerol--glycerol-3-phosphate 3-phosphatidyltransferase
MRCLSALFFLAMAVTDFLDGYVAKSRGKHSTLGKLLDPIVNKVLVITGLVLLVSTNTIYAWLAIFLIVHDVFISGISLVAKEKSFDIPISVFAKIKTGFLIAAIFALIIDRTIYDIPFHTIGMILIWLSLLMSLYSAWDYWDAFWKRYKEGG